MSNRSLKKHIGKAIEEFEAGRVSFAQLIDAVENAGAAIEAIPYTMVYELRSIESRLTIERWYEEEEIESNPGAALLQLKAWVERVPD